MDLLNKFLSAKKAVFEAEQWNALPKGRRYENSKFAISAAHCNKLKFVRAGQQSCGGQNYWESPECLNNAILDVVIEDFDSIYKKAIKRLEDIRDSELIKCQEFINNMQEQIDDAKERAK